MKLSAEELTSYCFMPFFTLIVVGIRLRPYTVKLDIFEIIIAPIAYPCKIHTKF